MPFLNVLPEGRPIVVYILFAKFTLGFSFSCYFEHIFILILAVHPLIASFLVLYSVKRFVVSIRFRRKRNLHILKVFPCRRKRSRMSFQPRIEEYTHTCLYHCLEFLSLERWFREAPAFWQNFLVYQTHDTVSVGMHGCVSQPGHLFEDLPDLPSVSGKKPVPQITDHPRDQKQDQQSQNEVRESQVWIEHAEDRIGFYKGAVFREQDGGRNVRGRPVRLAQILCQARLDRCKPEVIQGIALDDKAGQEFSHASPAVVQKQRPLVALFVDPEQGLGRSEHSRVSCVSRSGITDAANSFVVAVIAVADHVVCRRPVHVGVRRRVSAANPVLLKLDRKSEADSCSSMRRPVRGELEKRR